ncbi:hypothetical protein BCL69_101057 [Nitrosomonas communis]|uniref:Uncharacterized protein n=1 Tax=Nitrosomonas communis TaxID=44574 RepID=A0A5D3YH58_9PROT|nr:hypothetical protein BCL69_101057 [Nitrosomonas communis]
MINILIIALTILVSLVELSVVIWSLKSTRDKFARADNDSDKNRRNN